MYSTSATEIRMVARRSSPNRQAAVAATAAHPGPARTRAASGDEENSIRGNQAGRLFSPA
jgi:hypothetical protein